MSVLNSPVVLLVEDDPVVGSTTAELLAFEGFEVSLATNAAQALVEFANKSERLLAVILDVNLGLGASGYNVALDIRKRGSDVPLVFTTGDGAGPIMAEHLGRASHVPKPYDFEALMRAIATAKG